MNMTCDCGMGQACSRCRPAPAPKATTPATPPLTLSLEEIERIERRFRPAQSVVGADVKLKLHNEANVLLSMARRLLELESAESHLRKLGALNTPFVDWAKRCGWDPTKAGR